MTKKEIIINELNSVSDNILDEVIDFIQFLKYKNNKNETFNKESITELIRNYKGIAKGVWNKDGQEVINEMRADER